MTHTSRRLQRLLRDERGMALVMAIGILMVLTVAGTAVVAYATANEQEASRTNASTQAFALAEAGLNNALAIIGNSSTPQLSTLLPGSGAPTSDPSPGGGKSSSWYGTFAASGYGKGTWTVVGIGTVPSPSAVGKTVVRRVHAYVLVAPDKHQPFNTDAWKYIYAKHTGSPCDMTISNNSTINASIYVAGNLCIKNPSSITGPQTVTSPAVYLYVKGHLVKDKQVTIGTNPIQLSAIGLEADLGGCYDNGWTGSTGSEVYVTPKDASCNSSDKVYPTATSTTPTVTAPTADFNGWYTYAEPGPNAPCSTSSGTPPTFDTVYPPPATPDNSILTVVDLTPPSYDYSCVMSDGNGSMVWNHTTKKLTINGTIYIDGSVTSTSTPVDYDGSAALYVSGTFLVKNASLCAILNGTSCDASAWSAAATAAAADPTKPFDILVVSAAQKGTGGSLAQDQVATGDSIEIKSSNFQGALYGKYNVEMDTTSQVQGPIISDSTIVSQTGGSPFPIFPNVPFGTPGNPIVNEHASAPLAEQECIPSTCS